jgi:methylmalonyl-CoA mutase C-terminal domain/subunit
MYRGRMWTMWQFAGFGTAEETNERFRYLLDHGQTGLSTAFDMPSLMGHDSDSPRSLGEVGREGVAVDTGLHQTPEQIVETVIQEDADAVGLSILSGAHMTLVPRVVELMREQQAADVVVAVGGTIPSDDIPPLEQLGVARDFTPGVPTDQIVDFIRSAVAR